MNFEQELDPVLQNYQQVDSNRSFFHHFDYNYNLHIFFHRWYPGCTYIQQTKGLDLIRKARSQMTPDDIATADSLLYSKGDVSFLGKWLYMNSNCVGFCYLLTN